MYMDADIETDSFNEIEFEYEQEKLDICVQHVVSNKDASTQTFDVASVEVQTENPVTTFPDVKVDETHLVNFVRRAPMVDNELGKRTTKSRIRDVSLDGEGEEECSETFVKITTLPKYSYDRAKQRVKHITQNCNRTRIAISVVHETTWGMYTCDESYVIIYKQNEKGEYDISDEPIIVETPIMSMAYHTSSEFVLAVLTDGGRLLLMNTEDRSKTLSIQEDFAIQVSWVSLEYLGVLFEDYLHIAVACLNGIVSLWRFCPDCVRQPTEVTRLNIRNHITDVGSLMCFSFPTKRPYFVIGTNCGELLSFSSTWSCNNSFNLKYKFSLERKYWKYSSAILSVELTQCKVLTLAAVYDDKVIRIYNFDQDNPVYFIHPRMPVYGMRWNFDQFGVMKGWDAKGYICFFNQELESDVKKFRLSEARVVEVLSSISEKKKNRQDLTVLNSDGEVSVWQGPLHI